MSTPKSPFHQWRIEFEPLLGKSIRWEAFLVLMRELLALDQPVILETGTLREPGNWKGDGQSTRLWQWIAERKGMAISVDGDIRACELARRECPEVHVVCSDSVTFLRQWLPFPVSLLYLDSSDDEMNQLAELTAVWDKLPQGCLIASDDNHNPSRGKGALVRRLLGLFNAPLLVDSYILVWRKP